MIHVLLDDDNAPIQLTADYLSRRVAPYLSALSILQTVADSIQACEKPLIVQQLASENGRVIAFLGGGCEAIRFAETEISGWRTAHAEDIQHMRELDELLTWVSEGAMEEKILLEREALRLCIQPELLRLVLKFLRDVSPNEQELGQVMYMDRLLNAFYFITFSAITLVVIRS